MMNNKTIYIQNFPIEANEEVLKWALDDHQINYTCFEIKNRSELDQEMLGIAFVQLTEEADPFEEVQKFSKFRLTLKEMIQRHFALAWSRLGWFSD
jgi:hypothetical protein